MKETPMVSSIGLVDFARTIQKRNRVIEFDWLLLEKERK
jgi:hypothetical protein